MTTTSEFVSVIESPAFDESKHVNYTLGMLLGVDDFHQEFAYLAGRDRRLARQTVGYGTLVGLRVALDTDDTVKGPRIRVDPGTALTPRGHLVCVKPTQCAYFDDWLAAKRFDLTKANVVVPGPITVHIVAGYRDCATDFVLLPGSPCRDEEEMKIASRVADNFVLEIRHKAPWQYEEDAIVDYIAWLRQIAVGGGSPTALADFEKAIVNAAHVVASPPEVPQQAGWNKLRFDPPFLPLVIDSHRVSDYLRVAFRVWATELRPRVHPLCCGGSGCCGGNTAPDLEPEDLLLLASINLPVRVDANGQWRVDQTNLAQLVLDQTRRPMLVHTRFLQELAADGLQSGSAALTSPLTAPYRVVAAGLVGGAGSIASASLAVTVTAAGKMRLTFAGYQDPRSSPPSFTYVVKAMASPQPPANPVISFEGFASDGILLSVTRGQALLAEATLATMQFMIEVSRLG
jgi:hypothetical protein